MRKSSRGEAGKITLHADPATFLFSDDAKDAQSSPDENTNSQQKPDQSLSLSTSTINTGSTMTTSTGAVYQLPVRVVRYEGPRIRKSNTKLSSSVSFSPPRKRPEDVIDPFSNVDTNNIVSTVEYDEDTKQMLSTHKVDHTQFIGALSSRLSILQQARRFWLNGDKMDGLSSTLFSSFSSNSTSTSFSTESFETGDARSTSLLLSIIVDEHPDALTLENSETIIGSINRLLQYGNEKDAAIAVHVGCILFEVYQDLASSMKSLEASLGPESIPASMRMRSNGLQRYFESSADGNHGLIKKMLEDNQRRLGPSLVSEDIDKDGYYWKWRRRLNELIR